MSKFNRPGVRPAVSHPVTTTGPATTHEGGAAYVRDAMSELVLLAVTNMVGEATFYESAEGRDSRFVTLCQSAAVDNPADYLGFLGWLRGEANMRSAALVAAAVGVKARLAENETLRNVSGPVSVTLDEEGGWNRKFVAAVLQRPDEPGEFVAYWHAHYGKNLPMPVKRGLADAVRVHYNERNLLKYDTDSHAVRFGDVLDLTHAAPAADKPWQGALFEYALHRRHGYPEQIPEALTLVRANRAFSARVQEAPYLAYDSDALRDAGMTWEDVLSKYGSTVNKAWLWEAMIPNMGVMALLRNLRNFDEAGVSDKAAAMVTAKLMDPEVIAKSRQFPYRFLSAYRAAPSLRWGHALETALGHSLSNVPVFSGRTAIFADTSASMRGNVSGKSQVRHVDVAALIGVALAHRSLGPVDFYGFADNMFAFPLTMAGSVLRDIDEFDRRVGSVGHGTNTLAAVQVGFRPGYHDRVVIVHDGQYGNFQHAWPTLSGVIPADVPLFSIDTSGYAPTGIDTSKPNRYEVGGFSDKLFTMIGLLDSGRSAKWPWQA